MIMLTAKENGIFTKLEIKDFRCFKDFELKLARVNLIVGRNLIGKTSLLDGINDAHNAWLIRANRGSPCIGTVEDILKHYHAGIVLIDEIENGIHHTVMSDMWEMIIKRSRETNTQIFATTHSYECIEAAHRAFVLSGDYDFRLHRLGLQDGKVAAVTYDQEVLEAAIKFNMEVR